MNGNRGGNIQLANHIETFYFFHHVKGTANRSLRIVLMGQGCPENDHYRITDKLINRPLIFVDNRNQTFETIIQEVGKNFRINLLGKGSKAGDIRKHHRNLTPLAFQLPARLHDFCSQFRRDILFEKIHPVLLRIDSCGSG